MRAWWGGGGLGEPNGGGAEEGGKLKPKCFSGGDVGGERGMRPLQLPHEQDLWRAQRTT